MSVVNGVWHDAALDPPGEEFIHRQVLAVRQIGQGEEGYRRCDIVQYRGNIPEGAWSKFGVILWMPLPKIPEEGIR